MRISFRVGPPGLDSEWVAGVWLPVGVSRRYPDGRWHSAYLVLYQRAFFRIAFKIPVLQFGRRTVGRRVTRAVAGSLQTSPILGGDASSVDTEELLLLVVRAVMPLVLATTFITQVVVATTLILVVR